MKILLTVILCSFGLLAEEIKVEFKLSKLIKKKLDCTIYCPDILNGLGHAGPFADKEENALVFQAGKIINVKERRDFYKVKKYRDRYYFDRDRNRVTLPPYFKSGVDFCILEETSHPISTAPYDLRGKKFDLKMTYSRSFQEWNHYTAKFNGDNGASFELEEDTDEIFDGQRYEMKCRFFTEHRDRVSALGKIMGERVKFIRN